MVGIASIGPRSAKSAAFGLAAISMIVAAYSSSSPAAAREPIAAACRKAGGELAQLRCSTALSKKATAAFNAQGRAADARTAAADARGAAADARTIEAEKEGVCLSLIMKDLENNGTKTASLTEPPKRGGACSLAKNLKLVAGS